MRVPRGIEIPRFMVSMSRRDICCRVELKFPATWCYCPCGTMGLVFAGTACFRCGRLAVFASRTFGQALVQACEIVPNSNREWAVPFHLSGCGQASAPVPLAELGRAAQSLEKLRTHSGPRTHSDPPPAVGKGAATLP